MGIISSKETATRTCPGTGCTERLDCPASEFDPSDLVLCEACDARVEAAVADGDMHWNTSHMDPTHVLWCSHPELLARSRPPGGAVEPARACVAEGAAAAASLLLQAEAVLVVAGAGMSCDSGLPDFRGANGFYRMGGHEVGMEEVDFHEARLRPRAWGYITKMRLAFLEAAPHGGYGALRRVLAATPDFFVCTSNIDSYFARARFPATQLYECHGSLDWLQCSSVGQGTEKGEEPVGCCRDGVWKWGDGADGASAVTGAGAAAADEASLDAADRNCCRQLSLQLPAVDDDNLTVDAADPRLPRCGCGRLARPNVSHVTDTDAHIHRERKGAQEQRLVGWLRRHLVRRCRLTL